MINFNNTYASLPNSFYEQETPALFTNPQMIIFNHTLAKELGMNVENISDEELTKIFSGQKILEGSKPIALAYAGHQFGHFVPQLGDGRAHLLGETNGFDIQLKGSGATSFSRRGDGKSALGPVLREYIVSEAMHALGVPTTRALCALKSGETILRQDGPEPGGIFTRVASSHIRVGTFQYFAARDETDNLKTLIDYTIKRHYDELGDLETYKEKSLGLLKALIESQSDLVAHWSSLGFIHGVMNTDNFSLAGITIDYGPCAFMEEFHFNKVFSSIDRNERYSFFNQANIAKWNVLRLADCLLSFIDDDQKSAISIIENEIIDLFNKFDEKRMKAFAKKLGVTDYTSADNSLIMSFLEYLENESMDFTLSFRNLPKLFNDDLNDYKQTAQLDEFIQNWKRRVKSADHLDKINPIYIPRNHQVEKAIRLAYEDDFSHFHELIKVLSNPFKAQHQTDHFAQPAKKEERIYQTFCGT